MHDPTFDRPIVKPVAGDDIPFDGDPKPTLPKTVRLTPSQWYFAAMLGVIRFVSSRQKGLKQTYGYDNYSIQTEIQGAAAEFAAALALGEAWPMGVSTFHNPDVGLAWQVRYTHHQDGCLIVRDNDDDDHDYLLVIAGQDEFEFVVVGWLEGSEAKQQCYLRSPNNRPAAYFVPQEKLKRFIV